MMLDIVRSLGTGIDRQIATEQEQGQDRDDQPHEQDQTVQDGREVARP